MKDRKSNRSAIGVAVADNPYGPFYDPIGAPLVQSSWGDIDPTVFIDDDGQAYLYWGNPFCYYIKLNEDMISYSGEIVKVPMTEESFGNAKEMLKTDRHYTKKALGCISKDLYYLLGAGGPIPNICY